jgi:hypothetical protein
MATNFDHLNPNPTNQKIHECLLQHGVYTNWLYGQHVVGQVPYERLEAAIEHIIRDCAQLLNDRPVFGGGTWEERIIQHYNLPFVWQLKRAA